jgi:hypothetical protein
MRLVTVRQACNELYVSVGLVQYWVRTGRLAKHTYPLTPLSAKVKKRTVSLTRYLVDVDAARKLLRNEAEAELKLLHSDKRLLRPREVSKILDVRHERVLSWTRRFNLKKYYPVAGVRGEYFIDGDELADNLEDSGMGYLIK